MGFEINGMLVGNTPRGDSTAASVAAVDAVYGPGHLIRLYNTGSLSAPSVDDRSVVGSFKSLTGISKGLLDQYYRVFYQHEIDSKIAKGQFTLAQWRADMATLQNLGSGSLSICLTADAFVNPGKHPSDYLIDGITAFAVDFDGISSLTGYHDYTTALGNVLGFAATHGLTIGVPEFGANRATSDPSGAARAAWLTKWLRAFQDGGFEYACFWEQTAQTGSPFDSPAEVAAVSMALQMAPYL